LRFEQVGYLRSTEVSARARSWLEPLGYLLLAAVAAWWTWRALRDASTFDLGLLYQGGQVGWATGHPEEVKTFVYTPFLGGSMAVGTRLISVGTAADLLTLLNLSLVLALIGSTLDRLRTKLSPVWWWVMAFALVSFGPMMSSVWWKQVNIIAFALAVAGFELLRRERQGPGGALIGLSVAVKPLAVLLPLVSLARRGTRRAGAWAIASVVEVNFAAQALFAARAHELGPLESTILSRSTSSSSVSCRAAARCSSRSSPAREGWSPSIASR
jgi:hypothetical protein